LKWWYLKNCKVLIILFTLISFTIAAGYIAKSNTTSTLKGQFSVTSKITQQVVLDSGTISDIKYGIKEVNLSKEYRDYKAKGNFVIIHLTVQNNGLVPVETTQYQFKLLDNQGRQYCTNPEVTAYFSSDINSKLWGDDLKPGITEDGYLVFDIAEGSQDFKLMVSPSELDSSKYILLKTSSRSIVNRLKDCV